MVARLMSPYSMSAEAYSPLDVHTGAHAWNISLRQKYLNFVLV